MKMPRFKLEFSKPVLETPAFNVTHDRALGPEGVAIDREIVRHAGAAVMLLLGERDRVLLVGQYRLPPRKYLWELPAGRLDAGESPLEAAKRELREETGYTARQWQKLFAFFTTPGFCDEQMTSFLARDPEEGEASPEPYELIRKKWVGREEALQMVRTGEIEDGKSMLTLLYADRFGLL